LPSQNVKEKSITLQVGTIASVVVMIVTTLWLATNDRQAVMMDISRLETRLEAALVTQADIVEKIEDGRDRDQEMALVVTAMSSDLKFIRKAVNDIKVALPRSRPHGGG